MMRTGNCKHFNGVQNQACDRGISYRELTENHKLALPCIVSTRTATGKKVAECDQLTKITKEEAEAWEKKSHERMSYTLVAHALCAEDSAEQGFEMGRGDVDGKVDCPKCGKKLVYERSGYNGHIRAACSTPDCLRWIE